jgi:hypothetical protein
MESNPPCPAVPRNASVSQEAPPLVVVSINDELLVKPPAAKQVSVVGQEIPSR